MAKLVVRIALGRGQRMERRGGNGLANSAIHGQHRAPGREEAETHVGRDCGTGIVTTTGTSIHPSWNIDVSLFFYFHCSSFAHSRLRFQEPVICYYSSTAAVLLHKLLSTASPAVFHRTTRTACFQS